MVGFVVLIVTGGIFNGWGSDVSVGGSGYGCGFAEVSGGYCSVRFGVGGVVVVWVVVVVLVLG